MKPLKKVTGVVVSTAMDRTVAVEVQRLYQHPLLRKFVKHRKKYLCHDHHQVCGVGDRVQIKYVGQLSKRKRWAVIDMIHRQPRLNGEPFPFAKPPHSAVAAAAAAEGAGAGAGAGAASASAGAAAGTAGSVAASSGTGVGAAAAAATTGVVVVVSDSEADGEQVPSLQHPTVAVEVVE